MSKYKRYIIDKGEFLNSKSSLVESRLLYSFIGKHEVKNIDTKQSNKRNNQNPKDKTITWNKETQMTEQHEPLWKPEVKPGAPEG